MQTERSIYRPFDDTTASAPSFRFRASAVAAAVLTCAVGIAGCSTPVLAPSVPVPEQFAAAGSSVDKPEVAWWDSFDDPVLSGLIQRAAIENRDIKIAVEHVRSARAVHTISRSAMLPNLGFVAGAHNQSTGFDDAVKQGLPDAETSTAGLGVSWEIDLTGRLRAGAAAAAADAIAAEDSARGVRLLVLTDVASNYFTLVGALRQLDTVRAISQAQDETLRLVTARQRAGLASPFDVERARTEAERARAALPPLETLAAVSRHRIAVLIGDQAANASSIVPSNGDFAVPGVHSGQPATLLERRPDLLAYKAQLDAANARRRQATAEWFPRLFVGALFGRQSLESNAVDLGAARFSNAAAVLAAPIFDWGRTRSVNEIAENNQNEALYRYEDAIVRALEDVENALVALNDERQRGEALQSAAASADAALARAQALYDRGQIDLLPLLDAQRQRLLVRTGANDSQTQLRLRTVQLYKALGGGWEAFGPVDAPTAANTSITSN
jgi:outer membrane protein, multidrug efflux system